MWPDLVRICRYITRFTDVLTLDSWSRTMGVMETTHMTSSKSWFRTRYRIIQNVDGYYQPQRRWWWWPFWVNCSWNTWGNSWKDLASAEEVIRIYRNPVVKEYD